MQVVFEKLTLTDKLYASSLSSAIQMTSIQLSRKFKNWGGKCVRPELTQLPWRV